MILEVSGALVIGTILGAILTSRKMDVVISDAHREVTELAGRAALAEAYQSRAVKLERQLMALCQEHEQTQDALQRAQESLNSACRQIEQYQLEEAAVKATPAKLPKRSRPGKAARSAARKRRRASLNDLVVTGQSITLTSSEGVTRVSPESYHRLPEPVAVAPLLESNAVQRRDLRDDGASVAHVSPVDTSHSSASTGHGSSSSSYDSSSSSSGSSSSSSCD
jgi:hypothetical protein